jgi:penicillin-binding protein 1C
VRLKALFRTSVRFLILAGALLAFAALLFVVWPLPQGLTAYQKTASVRIYDRHGMLLRELYSQDNGRQIPLLANEIPEHVKKAFLSAEDHRFYQHLGVSPTAVIRALVQNIKARHVVSGGSTISQQLSRTLMPRPRTLAGKVKEALWAVRLELHLSKDEVLAQYLNRISFGNNTFGLESASQLYFGKHASTLSLGQAALLASLPRGPTAYNPYRRKDQLESRRQWVLRRAAAAQFFQRDEVASAAAEAVDLTVFERTFRAPHFVQYVKETVARLKLDNATEIYTTLDFTLQQHLEEIVSQEVQALKERHVTNAAAVVLDNATGEVLAYQGSADFFDASIQGQVDGVHMLRQPGSALKPFVYAEAFRRGYSPATIIPDLETSFQSTRGSYTPKNYDRRAHGPTRAREALANSYNVPAIRLANALGVDSVLHSLRRAGFESLQKSAEYYGLGLALGNGEVTLWELARAYAGLANGGRLRPLRVLLTAKNANNQVIDTKEDRASRRFADKKAVALVTHVLADNAARASAFGLTNALRLPFPVAAKTGTSKGYSDNWTVGFSHEVTVAVWAGNFDGEPMVHVSGITGAGPVFKRAMVQAMQARVPEPLIDTQGLAERRVCPLSGELASDSCPGSFSELFTPTTVPNRVCPMHRELRAALTASEQQQCLRLAMAAGQLSDLGVDYYAWAQNEGLSDSPWLAAKCLQDDPREVAQKAKILHPENGAEFVLFSDLPLEAQAIPLRVRAATAIGDLRLSIDGAPSQTLAPPFSTKLPAKSGSHVVSLQSAEGTVIDTVSYSVRAESAL